MSRMPTVEWLRIAEDARAAESFAEKIKLASSSLPKPTAELVALNHEASAVIARLADLLERGSNSVLIDKGVTVLSRWNQCVREAESLIGGARR